MTQKDTQDHSARWVRPPRGSERRLRARIAPPPYHTVEGLVMLDRRSYIDRRSTWIRDFSVDHGDHEAI